MPQFSLVLATVGRTEELNRLFDSLVAQTCRDFEVIVVDQNPDTRLEPYIARARSLGIDINVQRLQPPNLAAARNLGIAAARGDWICFPDDDCWYEPEVLANVLNTGRRTPRMQGMVACWVEQSAARKAEDSSLGDLQLASWRKFRGGDASSICLFFRRTLVEGLGGFDVRLGVGQWYGAGEETDYVLRALASGAELGRCTSARVHHAFVPPPYANWRAACLHARRRARGTGALYVKHRLSFIVILRGCIAPLALPLLRARGGRALAQGVATVWGRIEGMTGWYLGKHDRARQ